MKKTILLIISSLLTCVSVQAQTISEAQARQIASEFFFSRGYEGTKVRGYENSNLAPLRVGGDSQSPTSAPSKNEPQLAYQKDANLYVFNNPESKGFVIVSGNEQAENPILGWSDNGPFDYDNAPCGLKALLAQYAEGISHLEHPEAILAPRTSYLTPRNGEVGPLLTTTWSQTWPYNKQCPTDQESYEVVKAGMEEAGLVPPPFTPAYPEYQGHCPTGCVITATAQVMNYWKWPKQGSLSHKHDNRLWNLQRNFYQSAYDWDNMLDSYPANGYNDSQADAVAKLMADLGVAVDANYKSSETSSQEYRVFRALVKYFGYSADIHFFDLSGYQGFDIGGYFSEQLTAENRDSILRAELDAGRPVLCTIDARGTHLVVCDGYNADGYFHLNYGWGGLADGFYLPTAMYDGRSYWGALITGIRPPEMKELIDNIWYERMGDEAWVTCPNGSEDYTGVAKIQETVTLGGKNCTVTGLNRFAFKEMPITKVTIPGGIKHITEEAFRDCEQLQSVTIGDGVEHIGAYAFAYCKKLSLATNMSQSLKFVGERAFSSATISSFRFLSKGFVIDSLAFAAVPITIAPGLENAAEIRGSNFGKLKGTFTVQPTTKYGLGSVGGDLDKIIIPASVKDFKVGTVTGTRCYEVEEGHPNLFSTSDGVLFTKDKSVLLRYPEIYDTQWLTIPASVKQVNAKAFQRGTKQLTIPASVTNADFAFQFYDNDSYLSPKFEKIICLDPTPPSLSDKVLTLKTDYMKSQTLIVPYGCKAAYEQAPVWKECGSITEEIYIDNPFCYQVWQIDGNKGVNLIGRNATAAFDGNAVLPSQVIIGGQKYDLSYVTIGAFRGDDQLKTLTMPENYSMGDHAFQGCENLTTATVSSVSNHAFEGCSKLATVTFHNNWPYAVNRTIESYAFAHCPSLKKFTIPANIIEVNDHAFAGSGLQEVSFKAPNTRLWEAAFRGNTSLKRINGLENIVQMEGYAFADCGFEGNLSFPTQVYLNAYAFENNPIETVTFSAQQSSGSDAVFNKCNRLYAYNVDPDNAYLYSKDDMLIGYYDLDFGSHIATLVGCPPMQKVNGSIVPRTHIGIPDGTQMVYVHPGNDVTALTIPASVQQFVASAFSGCNNLRTVVNLATEPQDISRNPYLFSSTIFKEEHAATLYVPQGCVSKYQAAQGWSKFLYIKEYNPTSVESVALEQQQSVKVYNLQGQQIINEKLKIKNDCSLPKGIYIVNDKKVVMK